MGYLLHKKAVEEMPEKTRARQPARKASAAAVPDRPPSVIDERADAPERQRDKEEVRTTTEWQNLGTVGETAEPEVSVPLLDASRAPESLDQTDKERSGIEDEVQIDEGTVHANRAYPGSVIGEIARWEPVIKVLVDGIRQAMRASGYTTPVIRLKIFGRHVRIGPVPIGLEP